jgi:recombination protein RecT
VAEQQALAHREETSATPIVKELAAVKPYLERLLGPSAPRFGVTLLSLARRNPDLLRCDPTTVVGSALVCAQLELEPGPAEHVWLIPRWNKKTQTNDCTLLIGKNGMKALAERHPLIESVRTGTVFEGDEFDYTTQPPALRHVRRFSSEKALRWYAIAYRTDGGAPHIAVLDATAVADRRKHSASPDKGPWTTHFNAMAEKSAIRALWKELPSSLDMTRAEQVDDGAGVVKAQDLLIGQPRLIDKATGEIIDDRSPPGEQGSAASEPLADRATTVGAQEDAAAGPQTSEPVHEEPQATGPGVGLGADTRPAPPMDSDPFLDEPQHATDVQCELLELMAAEFRWTDMNSPHWNPRLAEVAAEHFAPLSFSEARDVIAHFAPRLEQWRINRRSRLASVADAQKLDLAALLKERDLDLGGELFAADAWALLDELEVKPPAGQSSSEAAASTPAADLVSFQTLLLAVFPGSKGRDSWVASVCERAGVSALEELTVEQLASETALLRQRAGGA